MDHAGDPLCVGVKTEFTLFSDTNVVKILIFTCIDVRLNSSQPVIFYKPIQIHMNYVQYLKELFPSARNMEGLVGSFPPLLVITLFALFSHRLISRIAPRALFLVSGLPIMLLMLLLCLLLEQLSFLRFLSKRMSNCWCTFVCCFLMKIWIYLNPQIKLCDVGSNTHSLWKSMPKGSIILVNHISFFDSVIASCVMPMYVMAHVRTCYKATLKYIPLFGGLPKYCGHFPVYFTKETANDFSVDRKKQNEVNDMINSFLSDQEGILMLFPEGQISKNAKQLQSFRHGSFGMAIQHKAKIYALVHYGTEKSWPKSDPTGGMRATVKYELLDLDVTYTNDKDDFRNPASLSDYCQSKMQKSLDRMSN